MGRFRFGEINYLNLLPFRFYLKRHRYREKWVIKTGTPAQVNRWFREGRIDGGFLSSIRAVEGVRYPVGIGAEGSVWSVLLSPAREGGDPASNTSNLLPMALDLKGQVVIGDRALQLYLKEPEKWVDLGEEWYRRFQLPFLFAQLSSRYPSRELERVVAGFLKRGRRVYRIPRYILQWEGARRGLAPRQVERYLQLIRYPVGWREELGFKRFLRLLGKKGVKIKRRWRW
ncbi:MAG: MqnA/MqnD/SBP family protein [Campylobacterales bacterium]